jgi:aminoglycoside phosphotransferase (APT) family kinase protein
VLRALDRYDRLAANVRDRGGPLVVTHGEPHRANTITTAEGPVLIDWETTLLAPPERDLWAMAAEDPRIPDDYRALTGTSVDDEALALYALWWELTEVCGYTAVFRAPHRESADTRQAWQGFEGYLASLANTT